jgi:hypothetical protein
MYAIGWTGTGNLSGTSKCEVANGGAPISLSGQATTISLDLANANCGYGTTTEFADASHASADMLMTELYFCTNTSPANGSCSTDASYAGSVRMLVYEYESKFGQMVVDRDNSIVSNCFVAAAGIIVAPGPRIPSGSMVHAGFEAHSDASCATLVRTYHFSHGLKNAASFPGASTASVFPSSDFEVYLYRDF